jgi:hypothetical protein
MPSLKPFNTPVDVLGHEIIQEQASALGRLGRALEAALAELRAFDDAHPADASPSETTSSPASNRLPQAEVRDREARRALVSAAGHALWMFMVQREACGLRETRSLMRDYRVPAEVQERMGVFPVRKGGSL